MVINEYEISTALLEWMKTKGTVDSASAEMFASAALAGLKKISLGIADLRLASSEAREAAEPGEPQH